MSISLQSALKDAMSKAAQQISGDLERAQEIIRDVIKELMGSFDELREQALRQQSCLLALTEDLSLGRKKRLL